MKNFYFLLFSILCTITYAQTSERGFSFQGYAIDPDGKALSNTGITARFTIYNKENTSQSYTEEQSMTSDIYGVFNAVAGSQTSSDFKKLNFTSKDADFWMKVEVKKTAGGSYITINDARMQAVPYAKYADNGVPVGTIVPFAGTVDKIPSGWALCDGKSVSKTSNDFVQLYSMIGGAWGESGSNFNLPDLRGYFLRGAGGDANSTDPDFSSRTGGAGNEKVGSKQNDAFKSHTHTMNDAGEHSHSLPKRIDVHYRSFEGNDDSDRVLKEANTGGSYIEKTNPAGNHKHTINATGGLETRPVNKAVNYIIKL